MQRHHGLSLLTCTLCLLVVNDCPAQAITLINPASTGTTSSEPLNLSGGAWEVNNFLSTGVVNVTGTGTLTNTGMTPLMLGSGSITNVGERNPRTGQVTHGGTINLGSQDLIVQGGFLRNNGIITGTGKLIVENGGLAKGSGDYDVGGTEVREGGQLLFGNSPGLPRISTAIFVGATVTGGDLNNATGTVGGFAHSSNNNTNNSGWSALEYGNSANTGGGLTLQRGATGAVQWRFRTTLNDGVGDTPGLAANFDSNIAYSWLIARPRTNASLSNPVPSLPSDQINTVATITLLDTNGNSLPLTNANLNFVLGFESSLFANPVNGTFSFSFGNDLVGRANTSIFLNYLPIGVPEPSTWVLILGTLSLCGYVACRRQPLPLKRGEIEAAGDQASAYVTESGSLLERPENVETVIFLGGITWAGDDKSGNSAGKPMSF